jgi:O-antigen chain-terminating methyltransferase
VERERLEDRLARLARERAEADRRYNEALTAVDRASLRVHDLPHPPPPYDDSQITPINLHWNILPGGDPVPDAAGLLGGFKRRLHGFVWRLVGPALTTQQSFNAAMVDHLNRNVRAHQETERAIAALIAVHDDRHTDFLRFQGALISYLQTMTLYVDTRDRSIGGQAQVINAALSALTDDWLKHWESMIAREERFESRHPALLRAYDELKEKVTLAQQTTLMLKREVEQLISQGLRVETQPAAAASDTADEVRRAPASSAPDLDSFTYVGFEDRFRGSQEEIRARLVDYLPLFQGAEHVLDVGCGRGELLDLFREAGIGARGIDLNHGMVEVSRERGLVAERADALSYLQALPDNSLDGLIAVQVAEHLEPVYLTRMIEVAFHKLQPGAPIVLETINPACWVAFFESYIRDVTHRWPLHPDTLRYLIQACGFSTVTVQYRAPVADADRLQHVPLLPPREGHEHNPTLVDLVDIVNSHADKLNARLFTFMDYAAIGRK